MQGFRYLTCADCDRGPIGITYDVDTNVFYVAHERVAYSAPKPPRAAVVAAVPDAGDAAAGQDASAATPATVGESAPPAGSSAAGSAE
jgi:hypothetical protein